MDSWVGDVQLGNHNSIGKSLMQILYSFWCGTQITKVWLVELDLSHNLDNSTAVATKVKLTPSNESHSKAPSTKIPVTPNRLIHCLVGG